jgi:murein DD-endopeptidase MepM/ murein hydrolase activator NlpD
VDFLTQVSQAQQHLWHTPEFQLWLARQNFSPVIDLPEQVPVFDFTQGYNAQDNAKHVYGIGRYDEDRRGMYTQELFSGSRTVHMGVDIGAPEGTPVKSFADGEVFLLRDNQGAGDYGPTLILKYDLGGAIFYVLYGHLSRSSLVGKHPGQKIRQGEAMAWLGSRSENGGWNPHLHVQISLIAPLVADLPGAVSSEDRENAKWVFPDPQLICLLRHECRDLAAELTRILHR